MDHIFLAVQDKIINAVEEIKWVDFDYGQLDAYELRPPVLFPCALIDIELPETRDMGRLTQACRCTINIRVAFEQPGQTSSKTPKPVKDKAMTVFSIIKKIHMAIHGFEGPGFGKIVRRSVLTEQREDSLKVFNIRFECNYTEAIQSSVTTVLAEPSIVKG